MVFSDESFLPQIVGLFYATFDPILGPTVLHQVPENLITSTSLSEEGRSRSRSASRSRSRARSVDTVASSSSSSSCRGPTLLDFAPLSEYVIPKKSLYGKLVTFLTTGDDDGEREGYRVMGFPSVLTGEGGRYQRNEYMWNLCFVFHSSSSLEAFEPVVRKCARILRSAEIDSSYLSYPLPEHRPLPAVLEQLFEDLNSYSETSINLDGFNTLELKLFPFFPNPPDCHDWDVPIPLVNLNALKDDNWDITAARVASHIDGVNHVKRIAELADADTALTRETLRHMLYYQVVMMVDIFQYSNMYTLKPSITRFASDETVMTECGPYVTRPGYTRPSWPALLRLYSKLVPGVTVHQWIEQNNVLALGIDPRRFMSFGIIKGFLRRAHRWPILIDPGESPFLEYSESKRRVDFGKSNRGESNTALSARATGDSSGFGRTDSSGFVRAGDSGFARHNDSAFTLRSQGSNLSLGLGVSPGRTPSSFNRSPRKATTASALAHSLSRSLASAGDTHSSSRRAGTLKHGARLRQRQSRQLEEDLTKYLDGFHTSDEIQVRFGLSWKELESLLGLDQIKDGKGRKGVSVVIR